MTQKLDQMTTSTLSLMPTNTITAKINAFPNAFERPEIQPTLIKTALPADKLTHIPNLGKIPSSTRRIKPLNNFLGQDRARASVEAGIALPYSGYNIFAVGTAGLGKRTMIKRLLQQHAKTMPTDCATLPCWAWHKVSSCTSTSMANYFKAIRTPLRS